MKSSFPIVVATVCAALAAAVASSAVAAGGAPRPVPRGAADKQAKLESNLVEVARAQREGGRGAAAARTRGLDVVDGKIRVVVEAAAGRDAASRAVESAGGGVEATYADLVQALVPAASLEGLARSAAVGYLRPPRRPVIEATTGEEIAGSAADVFQTALWSGAGVKVGIIDLGFAGLAARQAEGELPAVTTNNLCGGAFNIEKHGVGVAEIVHEVAPGAQLYLICVNSEVTLGQAKEYAKANGITIVNHSVAWFDAGRGDGSGGPGTVDGIVADARANGILWVNSAGNYQQRHWSGNYDAGGAPGGYSNIHDFAPGDETNNVVIGGNQQGCFTLKWDSWPTTNQDFDFYLANSANTALLPGSIVAGSENAQTGSQTPTEEFCYTNPSASPAVFYLVITEFDATTAPRFDMFVLGGTSSPEYKVPDGSLVEPASSPNAMAVGALCWVDGSLRTYSSLGPTIDGRTKPDIAGLDGVSGATYGPTAGCTGGFTGTSASSPHVVGLAALGKQQNPSLGPAQLQTWLEARARDQGAAGKDNETGAGRAYVYTFTDSTPWGTPLQNYIEQLFKKGTTTGCTGLFGDGTRYYCPNDSVTRRDMAVFLIRSLNETPFLNPTPTFGDVPSTLFGYGHVERLFQLGITTGCAAGPPPLFCPLNPVSRLAMAIFIVRAKGLSELFPPDATFADVPVGAFGRGFVERFYQQGITTGCATNPLRYCPFEVVDRKAMAAFLIRAFGPPVP